MSTQKEKEGKQTAGNSRLAELRKFAIKLIAYVIIYPFLINS
jgi:hypothetical protein